MATFSRAELDAFRGAPVPDLVGEDVRLLFVGINPGLWTAAVGAHFARRGNRFYPALFAAGITDRLIDAAAGYRPDDARHLLDRGVGITNIVAGASARADELTAEQLRAGAADLTLRVGSLRTRSADRSPAVVAVLGISAYRVAFAQPKAVAGRQPADLAGAALFVLPNPSGLNAHATVTTLAAAYRQAAVSAGIGVYDR